jgi:type II secretion system protein I
MIYQCKQQKGFTLIETLVAIAILLVAIVGPMTAASRSIQSAYLARDQITAVYLAQESMEQVMRLREDNALAENGSGGGPAETWQWFDALPAGCTDGSGCDYDIETDSFRNCSALNSCELYTDETAEDGFYSHDNSGDGPYFSRRVDITEIESEREAEVIVTIAWSGSVNQGPQDFVLRTRIFNIYDGI